MIKNLFVKNFKCFAELSVEMSNLNVFTGINSMGKSTLIQALLLLRQSYDASCIFDGLYLNGNITEVGVGYDLLYRNSEKEQIEIIITDNDKDNQWIYQYKKESDFQKLIGTNVTEEDLEKLNIFFPTFSFVSADRIGPKRYYQKSYHEVFDRNQVGYRGELFADYISERGFNEKVENEYVLHKNIQSAALIYQLEAWISEISPGITLEANPFVEGGVVGIEYKVADVETTHSFSPLNVGFGVSFIIPIILCLLKAKNGDLVIIENPEAHLHPRGQRKMGELIAKACAGGVQVIVETHSDHLLNGIRLAVKRNEIDRGFVRINYFYQTINNNKNIHTKCSPAILDDGSLSDWPDGFFDEWEKAIDELF